MKSNSRVMAVGIFVLLAGVLTLSSVSAMGVNTRVNFPVEIGGVNNDEALLLQNGGDESTPALLFTCEITEGGDVVTLLDSEVRVEGGGAEEARLRITSPSGAQVGDKYEVKGLCRTKPVDPVDPSAEGGSAVRFITGVGFKANVVVVEQPPPPPSPPQPSAPPARASPGGFGFMAFVVLFIVIVGIVVVWIAVRKGKAARADDV
jgi:hypothetical protein